MGIAERKEREKEQRRQDIIDAAEKVFFSKGFEHSTMDDVAEAAELSKGTLYLYFTSKEDLRFALSLRGSEILENQFNQAISPGRSGYDNLLELARAFPAFATSQPDYFELFLYFQTRNLEESRIDREALAKYLTEQSPLAIVNDCVRKGMQDGSLRTDLPVELFAATLWSQMMGVLVVLQNKREVYEMFGVNEADIIRTHIELVSNGSRPLKKPQV